MELVQEHALPAALQRFRRIRQPAASRCRPDLRFAQGQFGFPVSPFDSRLARKHPAVGLEVQLAHISVLRRAIRCAVLEERLRGLDAHLRHALQVPVAPDILQVVPGGAAAAVAVAERQQETPDVPLLHPVTPALHDGLRVRLAGIIHMQEGDDLAPVNALPGKIMIGEPVSPVIAPEDLLGRQVSDARALQQLGQGGAVAEGVRQPQQPAVHAELLAEKAFAVQQLAHQRLAGGHVRIRLHPHAPVRDPLPRPHFFPDAGIELRVQLLADLIGLRLALHVFVYGIKIHQAELRGKGARHLALGLAVRPEPADVDMGVADRIELRRSGAVFRFHEGTELLPGRCVIGQPPGTGLLEIDRDGKPFQRFLDLRGAQGRRIQHRAQVVQSGYILPKLIRFLVPDAEGAPAHHLARLTFIAHGIGVPGIPDHGPQHLAPLVVPRIIVPGISLHQQVEALTRHTAEGQELVADMMVPLPDPVRPPRAKGPAIHEQGGFTALVQVHDDPLPRGCLRQQDIAPHPAVFPGPAPGRPRFHPGESPLLRLFRREHIIGTKALQNDLTQGLIEFFLQRRDPRFQPVFPFRPHIPVPPAFSRTRSGPPHTHCYRIFCAAALFPAAAQRIAKAGAGPDPPENDCLFCRFLR